MAQVGVWSPLCGSAVSVGGGGSSSSSSSSSSRKAKSSRKNLVMAFAGGSDRYAELHADIERRWERLRKNPLEGVPFTLQEFEDALSKYEFDYDIGEVVKGTIYRVDKQGAMVDVGGKAMAFLPTDLASPFKLKDLKEMGLCPGVREEFEVVKEDEDKSRLILSLREVHYKLTWERFRQMQVEDAVLKGTVVSSNRGGLTLQIETLRGFLPFSQLAMPLNQDDLGGFTGKVLPIKFLEVDEEQKRLVVSHRKAMAENQATLGIGSVVVGTVQTVKPYGAFVDLGGLTGLLHVSQISHERITTVETVLQPGDKLKVMILSHDKDRGRISLSTKKLEPTPGDMLRNPALVYEKADEMAMTFRQRVAQAEAAARAEDLQFQQGGGRGRSGFEGLLGMNAAPPAANADEGAASSASSSVPGADILSTAL